MVNEDIKRGNMTSEGSKYDSYIVNSRLSFLPLINTIKKTIAEGRPGAQKLYGDLIAKIESIPELLEPVSDDSLLKPHAEIIEMLSATLFPSVSAEHENLYAIGFPFRFNVIYSSPSFRAGFLKPGTNEINVPLNIYHNLVYNRLSFAYCHILKKYLQYPSNDFSRAVYPYTDPSTGLVKYFELHVDARFVDVNPVGELPAIPENVICKKTNKLMQLEELMEKLPLEKFMFEGLVILRITDVTEQEIISEIKNTLLTINSLTDSSVYKKLQSTMQSLLAMPDIKVGITPFFQMNDHYVYSAAHNSNSIIFKHDEASKEKDKVCGGFQGLFKDYDQPVVFDELDKRSIVESEGLKLYYEMGARSLILCPLKQNGQLLGLLEIISDVPGKLQNIHIDKIEKALPLFSLAIEKTMESLDSQVDKVIKENFTAIQPAVEWKFTQAAFKFIMARKTGKDGKIETISFNDVHPLYGAIDIRNSSVERMQVIQLDLIEQLQLVRKVIKKALAEIKFPLLEEIEFRTGKYIDSVTDILLSEEELEVYSFLQNEVMEIFNHIAEAKPSLKNEVSRYLAAIDPRKNIVYHHRQEFEESISKLNDALANLVDEEQLEAQEIFPHYFERYVTDGVDFNIYIGQSISPSKKFDELYLRNMKMWQLKLLTKASRMVHILKTDLPHPLSTTQLILAHSIPMSISFRVSERKFDVDGAYNTRYEIIKKRIDKVRIKDTNERLTQPGKIAIIYSQPKEAAEYEEYIRFLQYRQLLKPVVEKIELEELQGVVGLKALRVDVNFDDIKPGDRVKLSPVTSSQLLNQ
jgi:hypothetical protein